MNETQQTMQWLQAIIDRSARTAAPALARNFIGGGWRMSAEEFVMFWGRERMASVSTVSEAGRVHAVPLEVRLSDGVFYIPTFEESLRLRDHRANPRCAIVSWDDPYRAVIVYGSASAPGGPQDTQAMVTVAVTPDRIYGIRAPAGHHAAG